MSARKSPIMIPLIIGAPMLSILEAKYRDDSHRITRRLNAYKKIFTYLNDINFFNTTAGPIYKGIKNGIRPRDLPVEKVERKLRTRLHDDFLKVCDEMRLSGYGREADKIEEFVERGEFKNAYLTLKEVREREKQKEKVDEVALKIENLLTKIEILRRVNSDVNDVMWSMAELLGVNRIKIPEKKMIFINDPAGNVGCLLSQYFKRMGTDFVFFSTKNRGDYWLTFQSTPNAVAPTLQSSKLPELVSSETGIVIIEDLNFLILHNKFSEVYTFLQYAKNQSKANTIIVTGSYKLLNEREITRLRGLFDSAFTIKTLFNPCTIKTIGMRNRPEKGALLLSKELVEDFDGKVVMIADFGGGRYLHPQRIDFEISDLISTHIKEGNVIIDCADLLIDENGLEKLYVWLKKIRDDAALHNHKIYIVMKDLISREKEFLLPLLDIDSFHIASMEPGTIEAVEKKVELLTKKIDRQIEKECAYNMEIIKHHRAKYQKYLGDFVHEIDAVMSSETSFTPEFLLKTTPLRENIEALVERIEDKSRRFEKLKNEAVDIVKLASNYVETSDIKYCLDTATKSYESGDLDRALDKISVCTDKASQILESAMEQATEIKDEILCIKSLLPEYFQSKLEGYEGPVEDLQSFTQIYKDILKIMREKVDEEYMRLKKYSVVSGISLPDMDAEIRNMEFCKYAAERDKFMDEFDKNKDDVMENMRGIASKIIKFLQDNNYQIPISKTKLSRIRDFDSMFESVERLNNHLAMFISKNLDDVKNRYPKYAEEHRRDIERILVELSLNPVSAITRYTTFMNRLNREVGAKEAKRAEIKRALKNYYDMLKKYNLPIEEWYPKEIEDGEKIVEFLGHVFGSLNPDIYVNLVDFQITENRECHVKVIIENKGNFIARNVSLEGYGAVKFSEKVGSIKNGEAKDIEITSKIEDIKDSINVDVFYENIGGSMITKNFTFESNLRGYAETHGTGSERCVLCRGKIFKGTEMVICSECGATYHRTCAERLSKCKICGNVFLF